VVTLLRGEIWWADLGSGSASEPAYRRPVLVLQDDHFNRSRLSTVIVASFTSDLHLRNMPGNVFVPASASGLKRDSTVNVAQLSTIDRSWLERRVNRLSTRIMTQVDLGVSLVLGLQ
jgi:mRNA interferase MazF